MRPLARLSTAAARGAIVRGMQTRHLLGIWVVLSAAAASALAGCGSDGSSSSTTGGPDGGSGIHDTCAAGVDVTGCTSVVAPSADDTTRVQTTLIEAKSGSTVCICP